MELKAFDGGLFSVRNNVEVKISYLNQCSAPEKLSSVWNVTVI